MVNRRKKSQKPWEIWKPQLTVVPEEKPEKKPEKPQKPWEIWKTCTPSHWEIENAEETDTPQVYERNNDKVIVFHATLGGRKVIFCDFCQRWVNKMEHCEQYKNHMRKY